MSDMLDIGAAATQASSLPIALPSSGLTTEVLGPTRPILVTEILQCHPRASSSSGMQEFKKQLKSPLVAPPCLCFHTSLTNSTQAHWSLLHSLPRALAKALNSCAGLSDCFDFRDPSFSPSRNETSHYFLSFPSVCPTPHSSATSSMPTTFPQKKGNRLGPPSPK